MPTLTAVNEFARAQNEIVRLARRDIRALQARVGAVDPMSAKALLLEAWPALIEVYGSVAQSLAGEWVEQILGRPGALGSLPTREEAEATVRYGLEGYFQRGDPVWTWDFLTGEIDKFIKYGARHTVAESAFQAGHRWARVPVGDTCAWCRMLASRGYVYASEESAGGIDDWHASCDCVIVPDDGVTPEGYDPDALYQEYLDANGDLAKMRENSGHPH